MSAANGREWCYHRFGMTIRSDRRLPGWREVGSTKPAAAEPPARITTLLPGNPHPFVRHGDGAPRLGSDGALVFAHDGLGEWIARGGTDLTVVPAAGVDPGRLAMVTQGSGLAALAYQRGWALWHVSGVWREGVGAVLFAGASGAGKSSMAAALVQRGWHLLADDLCRVDVAEGCTAWSAPAPLRLWEDAAAALDLHQTAIGHDPFRPDKLLCVGPAAAEQAGPVPVRAIVLLRWGGSVALGQESGADAVRAVLTATAYRPAFLDALNGWAAQFAAAAQIVRQVPVLTLRRPRDFARIADAAEQIEAAVGQRAMV